jgi:hypothetical protein
MKMGEGLYRFSDFVREFIDWFGPEVTGTLARHIESGWDRLKKNDPRGLLDSPGRVADILEDIRARRRRVANGPAVD